MRKLFSLFVLVLITYLSYGQNLTTKVFELPEVIYVADAVTVSNDTLTYNAGNIGSYIGQKFERPEFSVTNRLHIVNSIGCKGEIQMGAYRS